MDEPTRVRDAFEGAARARRYATARFPRARDRREQRALARLVPLLGPGRVLDLPCGAGRMADVLAPLGPVIGADWNEGMVHEARERRCYAATLRADAFHLPFADGAFAAAACIRLLHHLPKDDRRRVLAELRRVTCGPFVVSWFDRATLQALRAAPKRRDRDRGSRRAISRSEFLSDLEATGLGWIRAARPLPLVAEQTLVVVGRI